MTCAECRDELELSFGQPRLSQDAESHLAGCAECRRYLGELSGMVAKIGNDSAFYPDRGEAFRLAARVERVLDGKEPAKVTSLRWLRYAAVAASIVILAGIALIDHRYRTGTTGGENSEVSDSSAMTSYSATSVLDNAIGAQETDLGDADVRALLKDYTSGGVSNADEKLLNDLTEAEMKYLKENLKAKDLL
jgi:hypothetical protein